MNKIRIIDLLNKIANGEEVPKKVRYNDELYDTEISNNFSLMIYEATGKMCDDGEVQLFLNDEIEILEEEKKIPEKHINNCGDLIILGQQDNWTQKFNIKTKEMETTGIELNSYVFEAINENFKDIENKIYEIIDYLKSKGDE